MTPSRLVSPVEKKPGATSVASGLSPSLLGKIAMSHLPPFLALARFQFARVPVSLRLARGARQGYDAHALTIISKPPKIIR